MLKVKIEGIYESDIGSGQKKFYPFEYEFTTARVNQKGLFTHALRRFAPYLIQKDKKNAKALFSRVQSLVISECKKIDDNCYLKGKDILELNDWEVQDLACLYDLYEIPLHGLYSLPELREKAVLAYLEHVIKVPMKTNEDKEKLDFFEKQEDGSYKLKTEGLSVPIDILDSIIEKKSGEIKKKSVSDFIKNAGRTIANGILNATGNETVVDVGEGSDENQNNGMPSANDLLN